MKWVELLKGLATVVSEIVKTVRTKRKGQPKSSPSQPRPDLQTKAVLDQYRKQAEAVRPGSSPTHR